MQRWCCKLRSLYLSSASPSLSRPSLPLQCRNRLIHSSPSQFRTSSVSPPAFKPLGGIFASATSLISANGLRSSHFPSSIAVPSRAFSAKTKEKKWKKMSPIVSKVKKIKMKHYSSYKGRFRLLNDGTIRRWKEGKRHNAHLKSKKAKRRLRKPGTVPVAYAKVMKKLNFKVT